MYDLIKAAMEFVYSRFFSPKTNLIYDYTADPNVHAQEYLPTTEQIRQQIPNPCGWGAGMEGSTLNGGSFAGRIRRPLECRRRCITPSTLGMLLSLWIWAILVDTLC